MVLINRAPEHKFDDLPTHPELNAGGGEVADRFDQVDRRSALPHAIHVVEGRDAVIEKLQIPITFEGRVQKGGRVNVRYKDESGTWQSTELIPESGKIGHFTGTMQISKDANYEYFFQINEPDGDERTWPLADENTGNSPSLRGTTKAAEQHTAGQPQEPSQSAPFAPIAPKARRAAKKRTPAQVAGELEETQRVEQPEAEVQRTPSPKLLGVDRGRRQVATAVKNLLDGTRNNPDEQTIITVLKSIEKAQGLLGSQREFEKITLDAIVAWIKIPRNNVPALVKDLFPEGDLPNSMEELQERLTQGGALYREAVYDELAKNPDARKAFGINVSDEYDADNPLKKPELNIRFKSFCDARCLGAIAPHLGDMFKNSAESETHNLMAAHVPLLFGSSDNEAQGENQDETVLERAALHRKEMALRIMKRLPEAKKKSLVGGLVGEVTTDKLAGTLDTIYNLGAAGLFLAAPMAGLTALGIKAGAEFFTGLTVKELINLKRSKGLKEFASHLLRNNVFFQPFLSKKSYLKALVMRAVEAAARNIPIGGLYLSGDSLGTTGAFAEYGVASKPSKAPQAPKGAKDIDGFLTQACDIASKA